jgi:hypothetical protein
MTKFIVLTFLLVLTFVTYSFGQTKPSNDTADFYWLKPKNMTPLDFIQTMKVKSTQVNDIYVVTIVDSFPNNWLTKKDIDTLIKLIKSKDKCNCFLNPLSSYIPTNDNGEVGGYAAWLIKAYANKKKVSFGLHACPKVNNLEADKLIKWWTTQTK